MMKMEMPDRWTDVSEPPQVLVSRPGPSAAYYTRWLGVKPTDIYQGAECLYMTIMRHTGDGEAPELFNPQEFADVDGDGAREFIDGWGNPISWLRWPAGYAPSNLMSGNAASDHDPFDVYQRDIDKPARLSPHFPRPTGPAYPAAITNALNAMQARDTGAFRLMPLIWSTGPDGEQQVNSGADDLIADLDPYSINEVSGGGGVPIGSIRPEREKDDLTNHSIDY
jgi:hypothetical protein